MKNKFNLSSTAILSVISALIWEVSEELLENLIAQTLANFLVMFVTKLLSVLAVIFLTKGVKRAMSKLLMPVIKQITYKDGLDKMKKIKNFLYTLLQAIANAIKFVCISNPRTSLATLTGILLSYGFGLTMDLTDTLATIQLPDVTVFGIEIIPYLISIAMFVIMYFCGFRYGIESNAEADKRKAEAKAEKLRIEQEKKAKEEAEAQKKADEEFEAQAQIEAKKQLELAKQKLIQEEYNTKLQKRVDEILKQQETTTATETTGVQNVEIITAKKVNTITIKGA